MAAVLNCVWIPIRVWKYRERKLKSKLATHQFRSRQALQNITSSSASPHSVEDQEKASQSLSIMTESAEMRILSVFIPHVRDHNKLDQTAQQSHCPRMPVLQQNQGSNISAQEEEHVNQTPKQDRGLNMAAQDPEQADQTLRQYQPSETPAQGDKKYFVLTYRRADGTLSEKTCTYQIDSQSAEPTCRGNCAESFSSDSFGAGSAISPIFCT